MTDKSVAQSKSESQSILFISALDVWSLGKGKGGPALYKTLTSYANLGWKVYFLTGNRGDISGHEIHANISIIRFDALWLKRLMQIKKIGFFARAIWWLYFQVVSFVIAIYLGRKHKFDVVYGYEIYGTPVAKLLSKIWHIPMASRFQGSILRLVWMKKRFWKFRAWDHVIAFKIARNADIVIMTNDGSQGDRLLKEMGVASEIIRFWMNGLDIELFQHLPNIDKARQMLGISHKHVLLSVSRLMELKRVDRAISILPEVVKGYPDVIFIVVGDGPERENLEQLANKLGVAEYVRFEGAVPHNEIPEYLAAADIFLSFYDWSNVGNPLLEAMMAGKCIVTLNNGDTGQFVKNGENGILLEYEDIPRLPEVIEGLLADEERRRYLGANARKFAEENFWTWEERMEAEIAEVEKLVK